MGKFMGAMLLVLLAAMLAACESGGAATTASAGNGKPLGDTGVRVSGTIEAGGGAVAH